MGTLRQRQNFDDFTRASKLWDKRDVRGAFKAFLKLAQDGDSSAQVNVGYFYDEGIAVKKNKAKALYWYRRAYRRKNTSAAINIGIIFRDRGERARALRWFLRGTTLGDDSGFLMAAKLLLEDGQQKPRAMKYLKTVARSHKVSEADVEEATRLLMAETENEPRAGDKVVLKGLPPEFLTGLPRSDKSAISKMIGKRVRLVGYDADGRAELEFRDSKRALHFIYVNPSFISAIPRTRR